jgi:hypothetical protein
MLIHVIILVIRINEESLSKYVLTIVILLVLEGIEEVAATSRMYCNAKDDNSDAMLLINSVTDFSLGCRPAAGPDPAARAA